MPVVLERRPRTAKQYQLNAVAQSTTEDHAFAENRQANPGRYQVFIHHGDHIVLEAQYTMVDIQLGEILLVYAHLLFGLDVTDFALNLVPCQIVEFILLSSSW